MTTVEDARAKDSAKGVGRTHQHRSEIRDGMRIEWDVPIKADDGLVLARRRVSAGQGRPLSGAS